MVSTKSILRKIGTENNIQELESERLKQNYEQIRINDDKLEEERNKDETTKAHERYRRRQKSTETAMSLDELIKPAKKFVQKPGTYFYGPLQKLAKDLTQIMVEAVKSDVYIYDSFFLRCDSRLGASVLDADGDGRFRWCR